MKKNKLVIGLFILFICLLSLTIYTSFSSNIDTQEIIIKSMTPVYDETSTIEVDNENVIFNDKNQVVKYNVVLENTQDFDVKITDIKLSTPTEEFLQYTVEGIEKNEVLSANSTKELTVSFETTGIQGWGRNFADELTANISFDKYIKPPEAPATDIEELINNSTEIEIGDITNNDIEIKDDIGVKDGDEVETWIYPDKDYLGFHEIESSKESTKIIGIVDTIKESEINPGEHIIALKNEEKTLGYINIYINENEEVLKELPKEEPPKEEEQPKEEDTKEEETPKEETPKEEKPKEENTDKEDNKPTEEIPNEGNTSNKDEEESEKEEILPPNTSDKGLLVVLIIATTITGISIIIVSKNKFTKYSILVMLLSSTLTITKAEVLMELPLTFNINFESQNIMQPAKINNNYHSFWEHREKLKNFYIKNEKTEIQEYVHKFDVTEAQNNRVIAYLVTNQENSNYYDLYLQADGIIYPNENASDYFADMKELNLIDNINGLDTSNVTNMVSMFYQTGYNSEIFTLDVSNFDTSNVTKMGGMFNGTGYNSKVFTLDLSNFDTSEVIDMSGMFAGTGGNSTIFTLDLSNFDTSKVRTMRNMFMHTGINSEVLEIDVSNFDTSNVTDMGSMFWGTGRNSENFSLDVSNFDTSKVTNMSGMFYCTGFNSKTFTLDVSNFDTSKVTDMNQMFRATGNNSENFTLDVSNFDTSNVTNMNRMFENAGGNSVTYTLDVSNFDTSNVTNMNSMFANAGHSNPNFTLDVSSFDTSKVTDMSCMFEGTGYNSKNLTLDLSNFNTSSVTNMYAMFRNAGYSNPNFTLDISNFDTRNVTNMHSMFKGTGYNSETFNLDLSSFDTSNVTDMTSMFQETGYNSKNLTLDLSSFNTSKVTSMVCMFKNTGRNRETFNLDLSSFDTSSVTNMAGMFENTGYNSKNLTLDLSSFNTSKVTDMSAMFKSTGYNSETFNLNLSNFNTSSVTNMKEMFRYTGINNNSFTMDVSNFDTSKVTDMSWMFDGTGKNSTKLNTSITIRNPNTTNYSVMFADSVLKEGSQIKVNYTSETEELVDQMIATKYQNSNVVKGECIDCGDDYLPIGTEIDISGEKFNVISQTDDIVTMLAKYNLGTDYRQSTTNNYVIFSDTNGWEHYPAHQEVDIQTWSTNPKTYVNAYVEYLKTELGDNSVTGDLITLKELKALGCTIQDDYSITGEETCVNSHFASWLVNGKHWWTHTVAGTSPYYIWCVHDGGNLYEYGFLSQTHGGIRPVITISKEALKNIT